MAIKDLGIIDILINNSGVGKLIKLVDLTAAWILMYLHLLFFRNMLLKICYKEKKE